MRFRSGSAQARDIREDARLSSRAPISAVGELAAGRDPQLGDIFRNMRVAMKVTREALARRLATTPVTIDNFEAGAVTTLPHWKETVRIVRGYCELLRLDPEPILWRIQSHLKVVASHRPRAAPHPPAGARSPQHTSPTVRTVSAEGRPPRRGRVRRLFALTAPVAGLAALVYLTQAAPQPVYRAIALLPPSLAKPVRAGLDYVVQLSAPTRDGLKWIEFNDPQLRKADKLPTSTP
jgi:hypothetical protein